MRKGKSRRAALLAVLMGVTLLSGCGGVGVPQKNSVFEGNPNALRVFVRAGADYEETLQNEFPDIAFDFYYYGGLNTTMTMNELMSRDDFGDICISSLQATKEMAEEHLLDLSGYAFCGRYEPSVLSQFDVNGSIYQLPGYITMREIIYNKSMFDAHGWTEPQDFDELVALCRTIREDTENIVPIVMGGAANGYYFTTMTSYAQAEYLYTPEGQAWAEGFRRGTAKAQVGFGAGIEMTQELIDAGAFDFDKNKGLWDGQLFEERMLTGEAAMMFGWGGQTVIANHMDAHPEIKFGLMPFRNHGGQAFIGTNIPYFIGLSRTLEAKGNEEKLKNALRVLDWLSTAEGVNALSTETRSAILPLRDTKNTEVYGRYQEFWEAHLDSIKAPMLYAGYEDILAPASEVIAGAVAGKNRLDELTDYIDEIRHDYIKGGADAIAVGAFASDFTHRETIQFFANVLYERGDSDLAIVSDGAYKNGVLNTGGSFVYFIKGPVLEDQLTCSMPGSSMTESVQQLTLSGSEILSLLENGKYREMILEDGLRNEAFFDYYWAGADVEWKNGKITSVTFADGSVLEADGIYTVTVAPGDYSEEIGISGSPTPLSYTMKEALAEYMAQYSPVSPAPVLR